MAYALKVRESLPSGIKRIILEQIDVALEHLRLPSDNLEEAIYEARKTFSRLQSVLKFIEKQVDRKSYQKEDISFYESYFLLSDLRYTTLTMQTIQKLQRKTKDTAIIETLEQAYKHFASYYITQKQDNLRKIVAQIIKNMNKTQERIDQLLSIELSLPQVLQAVKTSFKYSKCHMLSVKEEITIENIFEWSEAVKNIAYQIGVLKNMLNDVEGIEKQLFELAGYLDIYYDFGYLIQMFVEKPELCGDHQKAITALLAKEQEGLLETCWELGNSIYDKTAQSFIDMIK